VRAIEVIGVSNLKHITLESRDLPLKDTWIITLLLTILDVRAVAIRVEGWLVGAIWGRESNVEVIGAASR